MQSLTAGEIVCTTVMAYLEFVKLGEGLASIGVSMQVLPPVLPAERAQVVDGAVMHHARGNPIVLSKYTQEEQARLPEAIARFEQSLKEIPFEFGLFA